MIHVKPKHFKIIKDILQKYPYKFYAYGSRVKNTHKKFSDLDLCFKEKISFIMQSKIQEEFEESDLPFEIDLVDYHLMTKEFQQLIKDQLVMIV